MQSGCPFGSWIDGSGAYERGRVQSFWFGRHQYVGRGGSPGKEAVEPSEVEGHLGSQRQVSGKRKASLRQMPS